MAPEVSVAVKAVARTNNIRLSIVEPPGRCRALPGYAALLAN